MVDKERLDKYVEDKIHRYFFVAKNFTSKDMEYVDSYCKERYDNNRKVMILDLIRNKEENIILNMLNEKINFVYNDLLEKYNQINPKIEKEEKPKKKVWKGFSVEQ